jgi:phenylalanyl-tRNA synthetase beta chain
VFNIRHGEENVSLFETGTAYSLGDGGKVAEEFRSAGVMTGGAEEVFGADLPRDFSRLKGILANTIRAMTGVAPVFGKPVPPKPFLYTHRQVEITVNGRAVGFMGQLHPLAKEPFDVAGDLYCFEISVEGLVESEASKQKVKPLPKFPGIKRDLAIIVGEREEVGGIVETILAVDEKRIRSCRIFDLYRGKQVPAGRKSLAFSLYIQDDEATLTDETGDEIMEKILASLRDRYAAEIRS